MFQKQLNHTIIKFDLYKEAAFEACFDANIEVQLRSPEIQISRTNPPVKIPVDVASVYLSYCLSRNVIKAFCPHEKSKETMSFR